MCQELISECDYCLFRRHISWEWCDEYMAIMAKHIKQQKLPVPPLPSDCRILGEPVVTVHINVGACPVDYCVSHELAVAKRKKKAQRHLHKARMDLACMLSRMSFARETMRRVPIRRPTTESLLTLAFIEAESDDAWAVEDEEAEAGEEGEWEDVNEDGEFADDEAGEFADDEEAVVFEDDEEAVEFEDDEDDGQLEAGHNEQSANENNHNAP